VFGQVVTPSLLHAEIVFARRLYYREYRLGRVALASAKCTVRLASGGMAGGLVGDTATGSAERQGRWSARHQLGRRGLARGGRERAGPGIEGFNGGL